MQNQARSEPHIDSQQESQVAKEGTFFLVSSLQAIQVTGLADLGRRGCLGAGRIRYSTTRSQITANACQRPYGASFGSGTGTGLAGVMV